MRNVRLSVDEVTKIRNAFKESFLIDDRLWLFGSRADLSKKGGDIDLYVETRLDVTQVLSAKLGFAKKLFLEFDDRKIDIVVNYKGAKELEIYKQATKNRVQIL